MPILASFKTKEESEGKSSQNHGLSNAELCTGAIYRAHQCVEAEPEELQARRDRTGKAV